MLLLQVLYLSYVDIYVQAICTYLVKTRSISDWVYVLFSSSFRETHANFREWWISPDLFKNHTQGKCRCGSPSLAPLEKERTHGSGDSYFKTYTLNEYESEFNQSTVRGSKRMLDIGDWPGSTRVDPGQPTRPVTQSFYWVNYLVGFYN